MSSAITLLLKEWPAAKDKAIKGAIEVMEANNKAIREFTSQLQGVSTASHSKGTSAYTLEFKSPADMISALPKIKQIPNVSLYYTKPDLLKEVSDAIDNGDDFKPFTLCVALYESFGKEILVGQFKDKLSISEDRIENLEVNPLIIMMYTHGLIDEGIYSQMLSVNKTRNDFIHRYMSSKISDKIASQIKENTPRIMKTLETLKGIYDKLAKEELENLYLNSS